MAHSIRGMVLHGLVYYHTHFLNTAGYCSLTIDEAVLPPDHPAVARDLHRLASVLRESGDFVKAKAYLERAISIAKASLSANNPAHDLYFVDLGKILQQSGYTTEAKRIVQ